MRIRTPFPCVGSSELSDQFFLSVHHFFLFRDIYFFSLMFFLWFAFKWKSSPNFLIGISHLTYKSVIGTLLLLLNLDWDCFSWLKISNNSFKENLLWFSFARWSSNIFWRVDWLLKWAVISFTILRLSVTNRSLLLFRSMSTVASRASVI